MVDMESTKHFESSYRSKVAYRDMNLLLAVIRLFVCVRLSVCLTAQKTKHIAAYNNLYD